MDAPESASKRAYFYVGGMYVDDEINHGERVLQGQMYVEQLTPLGGSRHPLPLVFVHGGGQTASVRFPSRPMCSCRYALCWNGIIISLAKVMTHFMTRIVIPGLAPFLLKLILD